MITRVVLAILLAMPSIAAAQEKLADQLRKAIVEEELNQKLEKAIAAYAKILAQYDEDRKVAATALFHFAECCRKLGQKDQAIAAYQRVLRDFADQKELAVASRSNLVQTYGIRPGPEQTVDLKRQQELLQQEMMLVQTQLQAAQKKLEAGIAGAGDEMIASRKELLELEMRMEALRNSAQSGLEAALRYSTQREQQLLQQEIMLVQSQIESAQKRVEIGTIAPNGPEMIALKRELLDLQMRLDALRKGFVSPAPRPKPVKK